MLKNAEKIQHAFDKAASTYDDHAKLQFHVGHQLISYLPTEKFQYAIDLGCGTGVITKHLFDKYTFDVLYAIDTSMHSLAIARQRLTHPAVFVNNMNFDITLPGTRLFNLAFANMSLHWSTHFEKSLNKIHARLTANGLLAFSIPLAETFNELASHFSVNHFHSFNDVTNELLKTYPEIIFSQQETVALDFPDTLSALRYIKRIGAHHVSKSRYGGLSGKNTIASVEINKLTYKIGYFLARKV